MITWAYFINSSLDIINAQLDTWPRSRKQDENRYLPARKILLVLKILICGDQKLVPVLLNCLEQRAILQVGPSLIESSIDRVIRKVPTKRHGSTLIK